jgi:glycosyltransferase involved in cell wall biosynthesis
MTMRQVARRVMSRPPAGPQSSATGHIAHQSDPPHPEMLPSFGFCAIVKTWMDEDVIEATVRNAMAQGAEAVYVVDNGSTDDTVRIAEAAGATVAEIYRTEAFDGRIAQALMNGVVARESLRHGAEYVWWLYLDSDEFPEGPDGTSIGEYLAGLDRRFRVVGSFYVNHLPKGKPEYLPGYHPIDFQPLCYDFEPARWPPCAGGHWKHPLQRFDRRGHFVLSNDGAHSAYCSELLIAPTGGIVMHHFQYRDEALTRAKLELTCGPGSTRTTLHASTGFDGFVRRLASLDAVYSGRWGEVETVPNTDPTSILHPIPWRDRATVRRWYTAAELDAARARWAGQAPDGGKEPNVSALPIREQQ